MTATMIGAMARPAFSPKAHHWGLAFAAALILHGGLALTLFQPGEPGALASGRGGIEVGLGPAGGAAGAPSEVTPEEAPGVEEPLPEATAAVPPEAETAPPEAVPEVAPEALPAEVPVAAPPPVAPVEALPAAAPSETPLYAPVEEIAAETPPEPEPAPVTEAVAEAPPPEETPAEDVAVQEAPLEEVPLEEVPVEEAPAEDVVPDVEVAAAEAPPEEVTAQATMKTPAKPLAKPRPPVAETPVKQTPVEQARVAETPEPAPRQTQTASTAESQSSAADPAKGNPDVAAVNGTRGKGGLGDTSASGVASGSSGGGVPGAYVDYKAQLLAWLKKHKEYPRRAKLRRQEGAAHLYIVVDGSGRLIDYRIDKSSGYKLLDQEVADMVERAQPLPAANGLADARHEFRFLVEFGLR